MSSTNVYHLSSILRNCASLSSLSQARISHAKVIIHGFILHVTLQTDILLAYCKCGSLQHARKLFDRMPERNMHSWNIMMASYTQYSFHSHAIAVFAEFRRLGFRPDHYTLPSLLKSSAGVGEVYLGKKIHGLVLKLGFDEYVVVKTSVLDFYIKTRDLFTAQRMFNSTHCQDSVSWNTMISGFGRAGLYAMALSWFRDMIAEGVEFDSMTIPSVLNACGGEGDLRRGREVHGKIVRSPIFATDIAIANSLIDMYAKCGCLHDSEKIFLNTCQSNLVTWTTMISCCGVHGKGNMALVLFKKLQEKNLKPNSVTLTAVLSSCSHSGLIDDAKRIFNSIPLKYGFEPNIENYACMVDLLARFGHLYEALALVKNMKLVPAASIWGALLSGSVMHKNVGIGEIAASHLFVLEPKNSSNYIALCSIYESLNDSDGVSMMRSKMRGLGLAKTPGCSWITIAGTIHKFYQGDRSHSLSQTIYETLGQMSNVMISMLHDDCGSGKHIQVDQR